MFHPGHRYKVRENSELMLFIMNNEEEGEDILIENTEKAAKAKIIEEEENVELSLSSLLGFSNKGTMKLRRMLKGKEVIVLIDCGATHNFIHQRLQEELRLPITEMNNYGVVVGNRTKIKGRGICKSIIIKLPNLVVTADFLPIDMGRMDVILGMQWLCMTRYIGVHWPTLTMSFAMDNREITLMGDPSLTKLEVSLKTMSKTWEAKDQGFLIEFQNLEIEGDEGIINGGDEIEREPLPVMIQTLLERNRDMFEIPKKLSPKRETDHTIVTIESQPPVNVRPYKYGHSQKDEIEKMVEEILQAGIVRSSRSPYSSPVLLVRKKMGGWRFCVDYQKLNPITIAEKFPILVIQELLDELNGSAVYSKLDLRSGRHQIRMDEQDIAKMAFRTHKGHYEFIVMPFGLTNAPATFQSLMNLIF